MTNPLEQQIDPHLLISRLSQQNASLNLQIIALTIALEIELAKNSKDGVTDGDTEPTKNK